MRGRRLPGAAVFLVLVFVTVPDRDASANPWTRDPGSFYVNLGYSTISASKFYGPDFNTQKLGSTYSQHTLGLYGEVGIIKRWLTAVVDATLYRRSGLSDQGYTHGLGDLRLGLWSGVVTWPVRVSLGVLLGLPTGDPVPQANDPDGQLIANTLPTGDGEVDVELAAAVGHGFGNRGGFWPLEHYALARLGYWVRTKPRDVAVGEAEDFPDAFNWQFELGTRFPWVFVERFWLIVRLYGSESFAASDDVDFSGLGGGVTHRSMSLQLYARIWRGLGISAAMAGAFSARSLPAGAQYTFGLSYER